MKFNYKPAQARFFNEPRRDASYGGDEDDQISKLTRERDEARLAHQCSEGVLAMTVARLGGMVEGHPTHRINFLQRIDELVALEKSIKGRGK